MSDSPADTPTVTHWLQCASSTPPSPTPSSCWNPMQQEHSPRQRQWVWCRQAQAEPISAPSGLGEGIMHTIFPQNPLKPWAGGLICRYKGQCHHHPKPLQQDLLLKGHSAPSQKGRPHHWPPQVSHLWISLTPTRMATTQENRKQQVLAGM